MRFCTACGTPLVRLAPQELPVQPLSAVSVSAGRRPRRVLRIILIACAIVLAVLIGLGVLGALVQDDGPRSSVSGGTAASGWTLKSEGQSLYAIAVPAKANLNLKAVVLVCEVGEGSHFLSLLLYPSSEGPLLPTGTSREQMKDEPRVRLEVDGEALAANIYFAGEYAVVANQVTAGHPVLSSVVGGALEKGNELVLRFDLVREQSAATPFDASATVALKSPNGASSIAAVRRRCGQ